MPAPDMRETLADWRLAADARAAIDGLDVDAETTQKLEAFTEFVIERDA